MERAGIEIVNVIMANRATADIIEFGAASPRQIRHAE
jgi:hypothetical protein